MLGRKSKIAIGVLIGAIVLGFVLPASVVFSANAVPKTEIIKIEIDDVQQIAALKSRGVEIIEDYDNGYVLAKVREGEGSYFDRFFNVEYAMDWNTIHIPYAGIKFDSQVALPSIPDDLRSRQTTDEYIVQFAGPIRSEWTATIEDLGGEFYSYFQYYSFLVKMPSSQVSNVRNLPYVKWIGSYQPAYKVDETLAGAEGAQFIAVYGYDGVDSAELAIKLDSIGATVYTTTPGYSIVLVNADASIIPDIAALPEVMQIQPEGVKDTMDAVAGKIHKYHNAWYTERSGLPSTLTGEGEVAGILDSGFDMGDANAGHVDFYQGPNGDRIIAYYPASMYAQSYPADGWGYQCEPHGTACSGIIASNGWAWETSPYQGSTSTSDEEWHESEAGVAPEAEMTITGAPGASGAGIEGWRGYIGTSCNGMPCWDAMYLLDGAHTVSNSWGGTSSYNSAIDIRIDTDNEKMIIFAAGNEGPSSDSIHEGFAINKNGLSIGASLNYRPDYFSADNPNLIADFSSRGGTSTSAGRPGLIKPDVVAIGTAGIATMGPGGYLCNRDHPFFRQGVPQPDYVMEVDEYNYTVKGPGADNINDYRYFSGTSQAAPMAAGVYMLIREYLREVEGISNPTSDLAKALLINGAVRMSEDLYDYPGWDQGWGRVNVQESVFPTPPRTNQFVQGQFNDTTSCDVGSGTCTDPTRADLYGSINTNVYSSDVPLKITLVWIDQPSDTLVRDINLRVVSPSGTEYRGNAYNVSGIHRGWSAPNPAVGGIDNQKWFWWTSGGGNWDNINNVEQVEVKVPETGLWTVELDGTSVPTVANFTLVFAADIGPQTNYKVDLSSDHPPAVSVALQGSVSYPFKVTNFGSNTDNIDLSATSGLLTVEFLPSTYPYTLDSLESQETLAVIKAESPSLTAGVYPVLLKGISTNDPNAQDTLEISVDVLDTPIPAPIQITKEMTNDIDPSVLVIERGNGERHIFIAFIKTVPTDLSGIPRLGGDTVWMAHTTLDVDGNPVEPWNFTQLSNLYEFPNDLRFDFISPGSGLWQERVFLTWTGKDPNWPTAKDQFDYGSWGRLVYSDPPYTTWNFPSSPAGYVDENTGTQGTNSKRVSFLLIRESTPIQEILFVWETLGSTDSESPISAVETWYRRSIDGGDTWSSATQLFPTGPGDSNYYFFPTGCIDQNDVAWLFVYYRTPTGNDRDLTLKLYDGTWSNNVLIWDTGDNVQFPQCISTAEGAFGNRVQFVVTREAGADFTIWTSWTDGDYTSSSLPAAAPTGGFSPSFATHPVTGLPYGPYTVSLSDANYDRGPLMVLFNTTDPVGEKVWITFMENSHLETPEYPANPYGVPNIWTLHTADNFATQPGLIRVTADAFAKGHRMADTLQIGGKGVVYEVYHSNKGGLDAVDYNVYLTIYSQDWDTKPDTIGPITSHVNAIPNPFNVSADLSFELTANINDMTTGMHNITEAQYTEVPLTVTDPDDIDWSSPLPMVLSWAGPPPEQPRPTEVASTTVIPIVWSPGQVHRLCVRGKDDVNNWGDGACTDVYVIGAPGTAPGAPTLLSTELTGANKANVTLTWSLSADDGAGAADVTNYEIYSGTSYSMGMVGYSLLDVVPNGTTSYTHENSGLGDSDDHFYVVIALDSTGFRNLSAVQGAKLVTQYTTGKHLISIPLVMSTTDLPTILSTLEPNYEMAWWYDPTDVLDPWKSYNPSKVVNDLDYYDLTMGLWINIISDGDLTVAGLVPQQGSQTINLLAGWNLIGFPTFMTKTVADFCSATSCERIETYSATMPENLRLIWDADPMTWGYGYWVKVSSPGSVPI